MQKIKMSRGVTLTFEEGCKKYLENCRQRNLREGTMNPRARSSTSSFTSPMNIPLGILQSS